MCSYQKERFYFNRNYINRRSHLPRYSKKESGNYSNNVMSLADALWLHDIKLLSFDRPRGIDYIKKFGNFECLKELGENLQKIPSNFNSFTCISGECTTGNYRSNMGQMIEGFKGRIFPEDEHLEAMTAFNACDEAMQESEAASVLMAFQSKKQKLL